MAAFFDMAAASRAPADLYGPHDALLLARQGNMLEQVAIAELEVRQHRLEEYQVRARYAMADSYDRATAAQQQAKLE